MNIQKDKNTLVAGKVVSTATTDMGEVRVFPACRLSLEDVAPFRLSAEEVARIASNHRQVR